MPHGSRPDRAIPYGRKDDMAGDVSDAGTTDSTDKRGGDRG
jgi:hypothetical protein